MSSAKSNSIYFVRVFPIIIIEPVANVNAVGGEGGEEVIEVCLVGTATGIATPLI
jgi:hypothetical protein